MKPRLPLFRPLLALLSLLAVSFAYAQPYGENTAEQKGVMASEAAVNEVLEKLNENCGTKVTATINWKAYVPIAALPVKQRDGREIDNIYSIAGSMIDGHIRDLAGACDDPLFKSNLAKKLKSISATPRSGANSAKEPSHVFKLTNGVLNITYHFGTSNTSTDTARKLF